jgi:hypothetical protein
MGSSKFSFDSGNNRSSRETKQSAGTERRQGMKPVGRFEGKRMTDEVSRGLTHLYMMSPSLARYLN